MPSVPVSLQSLLILPLDSSLVSSSFSRAHGLASSPALSFPATATNRHQFLALSYQIPERKDSLGPVYAQRKCAILSSKTDLLFFFDTCQKYIQQLSIKFYSNHFWEMCGLVRGTMF